MINHNLENPCRKRCIPQSLSFHFKESMNPGTSFALISDVVFRIQARFSFIFILVFSFRLIKNAERMLERCFCCNFLNLFFSSLKLMNSTISQVDYTVQCTQFSTISQIHLVDLAFSSQIHKVIVEHLCVIKYVIFQMKKNSSVFV